MTNPKAARLCRDCGADLDASRHGSSDICLTCAAEREVVKHETVAAAEELVAQDRNEAVTCTVPECTRPATHMESPEDGVEVDLCDRHHAKDVPNRTIHEAGGPLKCTKCWRYLGHKAVVDGAKLCTHCLLELATKSAREEKPRREDNAT